MPRSRYTEEQRFTAVKLAGVIGTDSAAVELGLPRGTVSAWVSKYGAIVANMTEATDISPVRTASGVTVRHGKPLVPVGEAIPWARLRQSLPDALAQLIGQALATVSASFQLGNVKEASDAMSVLDKLIARAEVLSGGVSDRTGTVQLDITKALTILGQMGLNGNDSHIRGLPIPAETVPEQGERPPELHPELHPGSDGPPDDAR